MKKWIKYKLLVGKNDDGTDVFQEMGAEYSESNLEIIKAIAFEEPVVVPCEEPEVYQPTESERLAALEAAMLEMMGVSVDG